MTSMTRTTVGVTGGVDTDGQSHHAAVIDHLGRQLGDREFPASLVGYRALVAWLQGHGGVDRVGVEGTRHLLCRVGLTSPWGRDVHRRGRPYATAGSRRSGRFVWHDPVPSKPEVRPRIKSSP